MGRFIIKGGNKLTGTVKVNGCKNAVLPILAATVLNGNKSEILNTPDITDTINQMKILKDLGAEVDLRGKVLNVDTGNINKYSLNRDLALTMRSSVLFAGALLSRYRKAEIYFPGGCKLGKRPIDIHLNSFEKMGVKVKIEDDKIYLDGENLTSANITLPYPSVGATQNIILAAVLTEGKTKIYNAAKEPEIVDLQLFLNKMGCNIKGGGTSLIEIEGVNKLYPVTHIVMADRIEAGTYLFAGAITRGEIVLQNMVCRHLQSSIAILRQMGCEINEDMDSIYLKAPKRLKNIPSVKTLPYPDFPTDLQPQLMSILSVGKGNTRISETVFENRNKHIFELQKMGADIYPLTKTLTVIKGVRKLKGSIVEATDLRAGASLVLAGLSAKNKTIVNKGEYVLRGYENLDKNLRNLGADIVYEN